MNTKFGVGQLADAGVAAFPEGTGSTPSNGPAIDQSSGIDIEVSLLVCVAFVLSSCALFAPSRADQPFRMAAPITQFLTGLPALIAVFAEEKRGTFERILLSVGAVVLGSVGTAYVGTAEPWRVAFGYLAPSALMTWAAFVLWRVACTAGSSSVDQRAVPPARPRANASQGS